MMNQSHLSQPYPGEGTKVCLQPIKILSESGQQHNEGDEANLA